MLAAELFFSGDSAVRLLQEAIRVGFGDLVIGVDFAELLLQLFEDDTANDCVMLLVSKGDGL